MPADSLSRRLLRVRVTPEDMSQLLGCQVLRFQLVAGVIECLATSPIFPETAGDVLLVDLDGMRRLVNPTAPVAPADNG